MKTSAKSGLRASITACIFVTLGLLSTPALADDAPDCSKLYKEARQQIHAKGIDRVVAFSVQGELFLRFSKIGSRYPIEHKIDPEDRALLTETQWQGLTLASGQKDYGCGFASAHSAASKHSIFEKYLNMPGLEFDADWLVSIGKDVFIIESTGIDITRPLNPKKQGSEARRYSGVGQIFAPGDYTRLFYWSEKLQKATARSHYKDFHSSNISWKDEEKVQVFFAPAENAIERFGYPALTIVASNPGEYKVCPTLQGDEGRSRCVQPVKSAKTNDIFVTNSEEAAIAIYKSLSPNATLHSEVIPHSAYSANCLSESYCNFPAANFIIPIYNNNYGDFKDQNERYTSAMVDRYSDHILVTNAIIEAMGFQASKENTLNLFPYFAENYLHLFDKKYPACERSLQSLSIRSNTKAYNIVDGYGNVVEKHDSVALFSEYNIPSSLVSMCNDICGQTGPSRTLSDFSNMMAHSSMVQILDGINQTMDAFACDSSEILTLENGMLGIYESLKTRHKQAPFQERSSLL